MRTGLDKRVIKTKAAIRGAFNKLVLQKDISEITISELVKEAGITRSTFYMYYNTVADVRNDIEDEIISHIDKIMGEYDWVKSMVDPYPLLDAITKEITQYDEYNRYIMSPSGSGTFFEKINRRVVSAFMQFVSDSKIEIDAARAKYIVAFATAGISECFKLWFNHRSSLTLEELCKRISEMVTMGLAVVKDID